MTNKLLEMDSCTGSSFTHQLCSSNQKKKLYIQREKLVLHVAFPQTAIYNYGTKEFTLKCMVRKWALMCIGKAREGCSSVTYFCLQMWGTPGDLMVKNPVANAGDTGLIPGSERSPGEGNGNPLQYSCLKNPMDREVWQAMGPMGSWSVRHNWAQAQCI